MSTRSLKRPGSDGFNSKKASPQDEDFIFFCVLFFFMYFYVFSIDAIFRLFVFGSLFGGFQRILIGEDMLSIFYVSSEPSLRLRFGSILRLRARSNSHGIPWGKSQYSTEASPQVASNK